MGGFIFGLLCSIVYSLEIAPFQQTQINLALFALLAFIASFSSLFIKENLRRLAYAEGGETTDHDTFKQI